MSYTELAEITRERYRFARSMLLNGLAMTVHSTDPYGHVAHWLGELNQHEKRLAMILSWGD